VKRTIDIVISGVLLALFAPVIVVAAIGCAVALRSWPLFLAERVGEGGRPLRIPKLRTLPPSTPRELDKYALASVTAPAFTMLLRRFHIDELPQLVLVLTGRLSLVGPRPEMPSLHRRMDPRFAELRTSVRPGCTGLWQVSAASPGLIGEAPQYDRFFVEHRTVRLELWVLWRTLRLVLPGGQFASLEAIPTWTGVVPRPVERIVASAEA